MGKAASVLLLQIQTTYLHSAERNPKAAPPRFKEERVTNHPGKQTCPPPLLNYQCPLSLSDFPQNRLCFGVFWWCGCFAEGVFFVLKILYLQLYLKQKGICTSVPCPIQNVKATSGTQIWGPFQATLGTALN